MLNRKTRMALLLILGATLVIKLAFILAIIPKLTEHLPYTMGGFVDRYDNIARNLLAGNGYRIYPDTSETLLRSPGYVLLLTGLFYVFGYNLAAAQIANVLFGLATAYFIVLIFRRWVLCPALRRCDGNHVQWVLLVPAILFLFHPGIILSETRGGPESLFTFLLTVLVYLLYAAEYDNRTRHFLLAGLILGLAMLVKSTPALIPIVLFPYLLLRTRGSGSKATSLLVNFVVMGLAAFIVLAPWGLRNYALMGEFILTSTVKGTTAHQGLYVNRNFGAGEDRDPLLREAITQERLIAEELGLELNYREPFFNVFYSVKDEVEFDHILVSRVYHEYLASPALFLKSCILNFGGFWFLGKSSGATYLNIVLTVPLLVMAGWGAYLGYRRGFYVIPMLLAIFAFVIPHIPILGVARYHIPLIPLLVILATIPFVKARKKPDEQSITDESEAGNAPSLQRDR